jgi:hypothetical protein
MKLESHASGVHQLLYLLYLDQIVISLASPGKLSQYVDHPAAGCDADDREAARLLVCQQLPIWFPLRWVQER